MLIWVYDFDPPTTIISTKSAISVSSVVEYPLVFVTNNPRVAKVQFLDRELIESVYFFASIFWRNLGVAW